MVMMMNSRIMNPSSPLLPKPVTPFPTNPCPIPFSHFTTLEPIISARRLKTRMRAQKKNPWLDPFDDGEDPDMEYGSLFADGKQEEDPRPPDDPNNPYGFLKFPMGYNVEVAPLALKVRGDVRRCCCIISGGVYENLLFFPAIQLIKDRYPGVQIDVVASPRGKQTYELNKNVRWANVYDPDDDFPEPAEYIDMIGLLKVESRNHLLDMHVLSFPLLKGCAVDVGKLLPGRLYSLLQGRYYDMVLSTKLAGLGHASFLFMTSARDRVSYIYPNVNAAGAGLLLSETFTAESLNLSEGGYNM